MSITRWHALEREPLRFSGGFFYDAEYATRLFAELRALLRDPP